MQVTAPATAMGMVGPASDELSGTCMVPGCSRRQGFAAGGVCNEHREQELEAASSVAQLYALEVELERIRRDEELENARRAERLAELRRQRERETWARDRELHERRVAGVLRAILRGFEADVERGRDRNSSLMGAAWAVGRLVAGGEVEEGRGRDELLDMARAVGIPPGEARGVIRRRFAKAANAPRILEERAA